MFTRNTILFLLSVMGLSMMLFTGCSDGTLAPRLQTEPYARYTEMDDPRVPRIIDLIIANLMSGRPILPLGFSSLSSTSPQEIMGYFNLPDNAEDYYPLDSMMITKSSLVINSKEQASALAARTEVTAGLLAAWLSYQPLSPTRASQTVDFVNEFSGIHWTGTYQYNEDYSIIRLRLTGTRDRLRISFILDGNRELTETEESVSIDTSYTYRVTAGGSVPGEGGMVPVDVAVDGSGGLAITMDSAIPQMSITIQEEAKGQYALNGRIVYKGDTGINLSLAGSETPEEITLSFTTDAWLFAKDGYWVRAVSDSSMHGDAEGIYEINIAVNTVASDGYRLVYNGQNGTLTDGEGNLLATLTRIEDSPFVYFDFIDEINDQGFEDHEIPLGLIIMI